MSSSFDGRDDIDAVREDLQFSRDVAPVEDKQQRWGRACKSKRSEQRIIIVLVMVISFSIWSRDIRRIIAETSPKVRIREEKLQSRQLSPSGFSFIDDRKFVVEKEKLAWLKYELPTIIVHSKERKLKIPQINAKDDRSNSQDHDFIVDVVSIGSDTRLGYVSIVSTFSISLCHQSSNSVESHF